MPQSADTQFDAIVVGAGPAGSTLAGRLHAAGMRVALLDKKVFPRVKPCAGWVTPQVIEALGIDTDDYRRERVFQPITGFRTGIIGGRVIDTHYPHPVSYGILRVEFDHYLLQRCGVPCEFRAARSIVRDGQQNLWQVDECRAPLLVGAGGNFCPVARLLDAQAGNEPDAPVVYAQEAEYEMSAREREADRVQAATPELYFCPDLRGYGWCFRKGNYLNVGLGRADKADLSAHVREFCQFLRRQERLVDDPPDHFLGHAYRLYAAAPRKPYGDGVVLVGDAAGLAYAQSGEGIRPAIESALIAADVIVESHGDWSGTSLARYGERLRARLGEPARLQAARWLPPSWLQFAAARLMATRWFSRKYVIENWFLHQQQETLRV